jgi:hypothetical protein
MQLGTKREKSNGAELKVTLSTHSENRILRATYTAYENRTVNEAIGRQILEFTKTILTHIKDVQSLYLLGGYGRGEGSILLDQSGVTPLGDYDFLVVSSSPRFSLKVPGIQPLQEKFHVQYHVGVDNIWKPLLPFLEKRLYWYEAKFGSMLLFGDPRSLDAIRISGGEDINIREGFSLLFNRLAGLEIVANPVFHKNRLSEDEKRHLIFQSVKAILACGECLLLLYGKYHFSYKERCSRFAANSESRFAEFLTINPGFKEDYEKATRFKLKPCFDLYDNPRDIWFTAKEYELKTLVFLLNKIRSRNNISDKALSKLITTEDFPEVYMHECDPQVLDFLIFNWNAIKSLKSLRNVAHFRTSFSNTVRTSMYYLAMSVDENGEVDEQKLEKSASMIGKLVPVSKRIAAERDQTRKWRLVRNATVSAWKIARV